MENEYAEIKKLISSANNILIIAHKHPDGDAIGSALAFGSYLDTLNKKYTYFHAGSKTDYLLFINEYKYFNNDEAIFKTKKFDLIIILDAGDLKHAGVKNQIKNLNNNYNTINIDHHASNTYFSDVNLVDQESSSTSEIIFHYFSKINFKINKQIADYLILGIYSDTQTLTNLATTPKTISVVSMLLKCGAQIKPIMKNLETKNLPILKLWSRALSRINKNEKYNIIYTFITQKDLEDCNIEQDSTGGLANFFNSVSDKGIRMILTEMNDGTIKGSLRSTSDEYQVDKIAQLFGGGGHKKAAGFRVRGKIVETDKGWQIV